MKNKQESHEGVEELIAEFRGRYGVPGGRAWRDGIIPYPEMEDWFRAKLTHLNTKKHE